MFLLLEGYKYPSSSISNLLPERYLINQDDGFSFTKYVGYYNNTNLKGIVLILPKIFESEHLVFGSIPVKEFLNNDAFFLLKEHKKSKLESDFIYNISLTLYLCLKEFINRNNESIIGSKDNLRNITSNIKRYENTELDLIHSLIQFYKENKNLITFKLKSQERQVSKRVNWSKTISNTQAFVLDDGQVINLTTINKEKHVDNDEEILTIYYTLLNSFKTKYGFKINLDESLNLKSNLADVEFERKSLRRLKLIKNKYFSDKFKRLFNLLFLYFQKKGESASKSGQEEYVMSSSFNIVFEDMIDKLLSDTDTISYLKYQPDGKIVDHIFRFNSIFNPDKIYYVGDSKYYKETTSYSVNSIYKQHTYAKNIIQYNINDFNQNGTYLNNLRYRDELTEGYNVTPNFFIQAYVDHKNLTDTADKFQDDPTEKIKINSQFSNRLFDRDTLLVHNFKINFLFVIRSYLTKDLKQIEIFKIKSWNYIRNSIIVFFKSNYDFFKLSPKDLSLDEFIRQNFRLLIGKVYSFSDDTERYVILALEKNEKSAIENSDVFRELSSQCAITSFNIE